MIYAERFCKKCNEETLQVIPCDYHPVEECPNDCDVVVNSAEYTSICECNVHNDESKKERILLALIELVVSS